MDRGGNAAVREGEREEGAIGIAIPQKRMMSAFIIVLSDNGLASAHEASHAPHPSLEASHAPSAAPPRAQAPNPARLWWLMPRATLASRLGESFLRPRNFRRRTAPITPIDCMRARRSWASTPRWLAAARASATIKKHHRSVH